jgi:hypothetical protein
MKESELKDRLFGYRQITLGMIWMAVFVASTLAQTPVPHPLLGQGWGVDHVGVGVRDLTKAQRDYQQLGFKVSEGGHFPGGLFNSIIDFENKTYLELLSVKEAQIPLPKAMPPRLPIS